MSDLKQLAVNAKDLSLRELVILVDHYEAMEWGSEFERKQQLQRARVFRRELESRMVECGDCDGGGWVCGGRPCGDQEHVTEADCRRPVRCGPCDGTGKVLP